jgi:hypothetical protein
MSFVYDYVMNVIDELNKNDNIELNIPEDGVQNSKPPVNSPTEQIDSTSLLDILKSVIIKFNFDCRFINLVIYHFYFLD